MPVHISANYHLDSLLQHLNFVLKSICEETTDAEQAGNSAASAHDLLLLEHQLARKR